MGGSTWYFGSEWDGGSEGSFSLPQNKPAGIKEQEPLVKTRRYISASRVSICFSTRTRAELEVCDRLLGGLSK